MTTVSQAQSIILNQAKLNSVEIIPLLNATGRILREDICADRPLPSFDKSLMDGIAIDAQAWAKGGRSFVIEAIVPAGVSPKPLKKPTGCVQIMTGAVLPKGCNAIIPIERVTIDNGHALVQGQQVVTQGQYIRPLGSDAKKGTVLLKQGCRLDAPQIALAASVGKSKLKVSKQVKVAVISTGDEIVDINIAVKAYQTRQSNAYALNALFNQSQLAQVQMHHVKDDEAHMLKVIGKLLASSDVLVLSGGVSMGEFDYVPKVLKKLGVKELFHKVMQKPGKPLWFGVGKKGQAVFGLPGNPVSTYVCARRYILAFLEKKLGLNPRPIVGAHLGQTIEPLKDLIQFIPVKINYHNGSIYAYPVPTGGSGDFASLVKADGFIEYDSESKTTFRPYFSWRA